MSAFTIRLADDASAKLDRIAAKLDRSRAYVAAQAIEDFISKEEWQLAEIEAGLVQAIRGDFAQDADVARVFEKFKHGIAAK